MCSLDVQAEQFLLGSLIGTVRIVAGKQFFNLIRGFIRERN